MKAAALIKAAQSVFSRAFATREGISITNASSANVLEVICFLLA